MAAAEQLMDQLGFKWQTARGKEQFPGDLIPYYHLVLAEDPRVQKRFSTLDALLQYLRDSVRELQAAGQIVRPGRKAIPAEERRRQVRWFVAPETMRTLEAYAQPSEPLGNVLDRVIAEWSSHNRQSTD